MIRFAHLCRFSLLPSARDPHKVACVEAYLRAVGMFRDYSNPAQDPVFSQTVELDLSSQWCPLSADPSGLRIVSL